MKLPLNSKTSNFFSFITLKSLDLMQIDTEAFGFAVIEIINLMLQMN